MWSIFSFVLGASLSLSWLPQPVAHAQDAVFRIQRAGVDGLRFHVEAVLGSSERMGMSDYGAWSQPRGWATFIENLRVSDSEGALAVASAESGWKVGATEDATIQVSYEVDLSHADWPEWPDGPRTTSAYHDSGAAFTLMGALLVYTSSEQPCRIEFDGPGWGHVAAPFEPVRPGVFMAESVRRATENAIAFGDLEITELFVDSMRVQLALFGENAQSTALFSKIAGDALRSYAALFGTKLDGEWLAVAYPDRWDTGEAYEDSFVLATTTTLSDNGVAIWGQSVAHELFHRWNGQLIRGESWADTNWFLEGVTDYIASLFLVRSGLVSEEVFLDQLEKRAAFYRLYRKGPPFTGVDLVTAGANKGVNNAALYDGGWLTAMALDVELQGRTRGASGIEDLLRRLLHWSKTESSGYDQEVLLQLLEAISGTDFRPFFDRFVSGTESFDLPDLCRRAGIEVHVGAEQVHARLHSSPDRGAALVRQRILRGAFDADTQSLRRDIDSIFEEFDSASSPGASLSVYRGGHLVHSRGYGLADLERNVRICPNTVFHAASVSKQFTAFLFYTLESEGRVAVDDAVVDWIPELRCAKGIRIRHLLDHTSGLRDQWQLLGLQGVRPNGDVITQRDVLELLFRQEELGFAPGTQQAYCNSGYTVLAEIISRVADAPFPDLARERIFEPLDMAHTGFQESPRPLRRGRALSYGRTSEGDFETIPIAFGTYGATGLMTTTEDLIRWARNAWEFRVGSPEIYERMLERGRLSDGSEVNFTNGLHVRKRLGYTSLGHPGADAGYRSAVVSVPEERIAVALLGNVDTVDMWGSPDRVLAHLLPERTQADPGDGQSTGENDDEEPPPHITSEPPTRIDELIGHYYSRELDTTYELAVVDGLLVAQHVRNGTLALKPEGKDRFLCDRWFLAEISIERAEDGRAVAFRASSARSRGVQFVRR